MYKFIFIAIYIEGKFVVISHDTPHSIIAILPITFEKILKKKLYNKI